MLKLYAHQVDTVLLIDSPAFNIPFAKLIKKKAPHLRIIYYILPQVWAWKKARVKILEKTVDELLCILPFEPQFWTRAKYIGNPVAQETSKLKSSPQKDTTVFLAGSRKAEVKRLMPIFRSLAKSLNGEKIIAISEFFPKEEIQSTYGDLSDFSVSFNAKKSLALAQKAVVCSGTASLETSLLEVPFVLVYKAKRLDYFIAKRFVKLPFIGLANLICFFNNKPQIHKELIQNEVTKENILKALSELNEKDFQKKAKELKSLIGSKDPSEILLQTLTNKP